ncbi:MAG: hypothetical protein KGZ54_03505, partial [Dethiobacter sp.]|nr:hypothetical protein [Dethiobacter sp.]
FACPVQKLNPSWVAFASTKQFIRIVLTMLTSHGVSCLVFKEHPALLVYLAQQELYYTSFSLSVQAPFCETPICCFLFSSLRHKSYPNMFADLCQ